MYSKIDEIKRIGDSDPVSALGLLQHLDRELDKTDEHIENLRKMLRIRLRDKAYIKATTDKEVKDVVEYFENKGNWEEKQEANYYAGSVYRDLDDVPRALTYFLRSIECAEKGSVTDSLLLRNTYSQLYGLYFNVQDYPNALVMARKEAFVAEKLRIIDASTMLHESAALLRLDSMLTAKEVILRAFEYAKSKDSQTDIYSLASLLYQLSSFNYMKEARTCYERIRAKGLNLDLPTSTYLSIGKYFSTLEQTDSAIYYYNKVIQDSHELNHLYDASRNLSLIYDSQNDPEKANRFAQMFIQISDTLNLEKRQTEAASSHNKYKYQKNKEEEQKMKEKKDLYHRVLLIVIFSFCIVVLLFTYLWIFKKNAHLKEILSKTHELERIKTKNNKLQNEIEEQEHHLARVKERLGNNELEMKQMKEELATSDNALQLAKIQLEERLMQSRSILKLLHQTQFENSTDDIILKLRKAANGLYQMTDLDWKKFHRAVNDLYPDFADRMVVHLGKKINDKQLLFCELMRVGITNPQIQVLMDMPKATVWRWAKRYEWILAQEHEMSLAKDA
ncbi:MAG: hypothetical protein KBT12_01045 [Bacteroidales bacterium]|nr:hypothetical protein [Candidatus Physcousia equi]